MQGKKRFPIPNVVYSIASKGAAWFHYPFNSGENKRKLEELRRSFNGNSDSSGN
jgi:hypothetical protein